MSSGRCDLHLAGGGLLPVLGGSVTTVSGTPECVPWWRAGSRSGDG